MSRKFAVILAALALLASGTWLATHSFLLQDSLWDYGVCHAASRAWLTGHDPYDADALARWWANCGLSGHFCADISGLPPVSPPTLLVTLAPLALLPATIAAWTFLAITAALLIFQILALLGLAELELVSPRAMLLAAWVMMLAPVRIATLAGQPAGPAVALVVIGLWAVSKRSQRVGGLLLGVAAAIKIQIGLPFLLVLPFMGRLRGSLWGLATLFFIATISLIGLHLGHTSWLASWKASLTLVAQRGGVNDFDRLNIYNSELLNLQLLVHSLVASRALTNILSVSVWGVAILFFLIQLLRRQSTAAGRDDLLAFATIAPLLLLPVYHRYYDASILTLTMAWVMREWFRPRPGIPRFVGVLLLLMLFTPESIVIHITPHLPRRFVETTLFEAFVVAHRVWLLVLVTCTMIREVARGDALKLPR